MSTAQKSALITGSGRNIGRAMATLLGSHGYQVVLNGSSDRNACEKVADEVRSAGGTALVAMGDVGVREQALGVAQAGLDQFGRIDVLINNAALRPDCSLLDVDEDEWDRIMNVNYKSAFWLARACLPAMIDRGWGRIINFTGMNAQNGYAGKSHVTVSKHAAWGLTKAMAKEFGPKGITTNIISPGTIVGEFEDPGHHRDFDALAKTNPAGRLGTPADIAGAVDLLVSDAGGFINGQLIQVNGGVIV